MRSVRLNFSDESIHSSDALEIIFPNRKTRDAARLFVDWLKNKGGTASKNAVSNFADELHNGSMSVKGIPFTYSRRNFYLTVLRTLVDLGFIQRNVPVWDSMRRQTIYVYSRNIFDITQKPPSVGFWRLTYYICRKWNELFLEQVQEAQLNLN
ncbi:MAG: hypothetical protein HYU02_06650 [Thaumarchaeota archaeon]|nr:hypothetical protein [Nitrososphaerota archaeon]